MNMRSDEDGNRKTGQGQTLAEVADEMLAETVEATSAEDAAQAAVADEVLAKVAASVVEGDGLPEHTGPPTVAVLGGWARGTGVSAGGLGRSKRASRARRQLPDRRRHRSVADEPQGQRGGPLHDRDGTQPARGGR